jgi:tetratricopeptide (TPR) repeat protein
MTNRNRDAYNEAVIAAKLDPKRIESLYYAAFLAQALGEFAATLEYTGSILKECPDYKDTYLLRGFGLQKTGKLDECISAYRAYLLQNPGHFQTWFNLCYALKDKGSYKEAVECFNRVLDLKPDYDEARQWLLFCYNKTGAGLQAEFENMVLQNKYVGMQIRQFIPSFVSDCVTARILTDLSSSPLMGEDQGEGEFPTIYFLFAPHPHPAAAGVEGVTTQFVGDPEQRHLWMTF